MLLSVILDRRSGDLEFEAAEGGRGTVELSFEVDASDVTSDMATVAFETCYRGEVRKGNRVDEHADLTDADQTVMLKEPAGKEDQPTKTPTRRTATPAKTTVKDRPGIKSPEIMPQTGQGILAVMLVAAGTALIAAALVRARRR